MTARHDIHCTDLVSCASSYVDGTVEPRLRGRLEEHLALCAGCSAYIGQFDETVRLLRRLAAGPPSPARLAQLERLLAGRRPE